MGSETVFRAFTDRATPGGLNLIEGNRGLHDGEDGAGTHSSAELAKLLQTPVLLIIPTVKVTRTAAAIALGLQSLDPKVEIAGVILNRVATSRQEAVIRAAIESSTGLPVLGAIPRITEGVLSSRHLGLITPEEHARSREVVDLAAKVITQNVDLQKVRSAAEDAVPLAPPHQKFPSEKNTGANLKIGYFKSSAFTFYYPENLEAVENAGAVLTAVDPLQDRLLPDLDALYIGGGFPETHAARLAANGGFLASVAKASQSGLPIWAECGGLIFLCSSVYWEGNRYPMAGVFDADIILDRMPAGHGYEEVLVDQPNPFIRKGARLRGHEFHYSKLQAAGPLPTMFQVNRGTGLGDGRDGLMINRTVATYLHLHALAAPEWVGGLLAAAREYSNSSAHQPESGHTESEAGRE
jgi:cobyrinic acid a,c-diamide synthase